MLAHAGRRSRHLSSRVQQTPGHRLTTAPSFAQPDIAKHPVQFTKGQGGASIYGG
jgi:hypothetical protein